MPQGGARGQSLGHLYSCHLVIPSVYLKKGSSCGDFKGKSLPSLNEYWGKHCALITSMDKLYYLEPKWDNSDPTLPLPYPVLPFYPTNILPYPIPTLPISYPIPNLTLPNPSPYYTLPYLTIPYPSLPHSKLSNPTLPLPYPSPTLPHHTHTLPYPRLP